MRLSCVFIVRYPLLCVVNVIPEPTYRGCRRCLSALDAAAWDKVDHIVQVHNETVNRPEGAATVAVDIEGTDRSAVLGELPSLCLPPQSITMWQAGELEVAAMSKPFISDMMLVFVCIVTRGFVILTVLARELAQIAAGSGVLAGYQEIGSADGLAAGAVAVGQQREVEERVDDGRRSSSIHR